MTQLFLYLSLVFASAISQSDQFDVNLDGGIHKNISCLESSDLEPNVDFDNSDASTNSNLTLTILTNKHFYLSRISNDKEQSVYRNNAARAPPSF